MSISPDGQIGFGTGQGGDDVNRIHDYDDIDLGRLSHHHSLGIGSGQASPGDHTHNGKDSKFLSSGGVPVAATTVVTETAFGQASAVGAGVKFARDDHTHGTPAAPTIPTASGTVVTETSASQAANAGVATTYSRGDHTHGTPGAGGGPSPATTVTSGATFGTASAVGTATTYAREDHQHGTPVVPVKTLDAAASAALTLTNTFTDVPGMTATVTTVKATAQIIVNVGVDFICNTALAGATLQAQLVINGVAQAGLCVADSAIVGRKGCMGQTWARVIGIVTGQIVKIQGLKSSAASPPTGQILNTSSRMTVLIVDI